MARERVHRSSRWAASSNVELAGRHLHRGGGDGGQEERRAVGGPGSGIGSLVTGGSHGTVAVVGVADEGTLIEDGGTEGQGGERQSDSGELHCDGGYLRVLVEDEICSGGMDEVDWLAEIPWRAREGEKRRAEGTRGGRRCRYICICVCGGLQLLLLLLLLLLLAAALPYLAAAHTRRGPWLRSDGTLGWAAIAGRRPTCLLGARLSERVTIYGVHGLARVRPPVGPAWSDVPAFP